MRREAVPAVVAAGLFLTGCGVAAASSTHGQAGGAAHSEYGRVAGNFEREGGPIGPGGQQPPVVPLPGTMHFQRHGHRGVRVKVGNSGTFSVRLAPGSYSVSGSTPGMFGRCRLAGKVTVRAGRTRHIVVSCIVP
jgi:hypothetical protein